MLKLQIKGKPENRDEIRRAVDTKCAELGISRSTFAVEYLHSAPHKLNLMLSGKVRPSANPNIVAQVNEFVGATAEAWER